MWVTIIIAGTNLVFCWCCQRISSFGLQIMIAVKILIEINVTVLLKTFEYVLNVTPASFRYSDMHGNCKSNINDYSG